jgi:hypothetical protein
MNKMTLSISTVAMSALIGGALGLASTASAVPTGGANAQDTISQLEAGGNRVIVHRLSDAPLSQADVVAVEPGPALRGQTWDFDHNTNYQNVITGKVYYVDVR